VRTKDIRFPTEHGSISPQTFSGQSKRGCHRVGTRHTRPSPRSPAYHAFGKTATLAGDLLLIENGVADTRTDRVKCAQLNILAHR
jgi:hypothetical protein